MITQAVLRAQIDRYNEFYTMAGAAQYDCRVVYSRSGLLDVSYYSATVAGLPRIYCILMIPCQDSDIHGPESSLTLDMEHELYLPP